MIYSYLRVSNPSSLDGSSLEIQESDNRRYAGIVLPGEPWATRCYPDNMPPGVFCDGAVSAWNRRIWDRPAGKIMSPLLGKGDHVIFHQLDRGFRSLIDFCNTIPVWLDRGVSIHFVTQHLNFDSAAGRFLANVLAAYAEFKSDLISERTKEAKAAKQRGDQRPKKRQPAERVTTYGVHIPIHLLVPPEAAIGGVIYCYCRVSHIQSARSGLSITAQRAACEGYVRLLQERHPHLKVGEVFVDEAVSAYRVPLAGRGGGKLLCAALKPGDHVVVSKLDRAWRSVADLVNCVNRWKEHGITVHFADSWIDCSTVQGNAFIQILGVFSELESADASIRKVRAFAELKSRNILTAPSHKLKWTKSVPHPDEPGAEMLIPDEFWVGIMWLIALYRSHKLSYLEIANILEPVVAQHEGRRTIPQSGFTASAGRRQFRGKLRMVHGVTAHTAQKWYQCCWPKVRAWLEYQQQQVGGTYQPLPPVAEFVPKSFRAVAKSTKLVSTLQDRQK